MANPTESAALFKADSVMLGVSARKPDNKVTVIFLGGMACSQSPAE
jgi:hypothetical protein